MTINDSVISEQGMCEEEQVARIAWFYYHDGLTQSEISDRLGLDPFESVAITGERASIRHYSRTD